MERELVVVTGGSRGIGKAIVEVFAEAGCDVVTCARNGDILQDALAGWKSKFPQVAVTGVVADLSELAGVKSFAAFVHTHHKKVTVLVNNAGYFMPGSILNEPAGNLEQMMAANLFGVYHLCRELMPAMQAARKGHVFNLCSVASIKSYPAGGSYSITKFALLGLTKCLREEVMSDNLRVTAVLPGATLTDSWAGSGLPETRFMKSTDIAKAIFSCWQLSETTVVEEILLRPVLGDI